MIWELLIQGLYSYKGLLASAFPFMILGFCLTPNGNVRKVMTWFMLTTVLFHFVPSWESIKEARALSLIDERIKSKDVAEMCSSIVKPKFKTRNRYAKL